MLSTLAAGGTTDPQERVLFDLPQFGGEHAEEVVFLGDFRDDFARCHLNETGLIMRIGMAEQEEDRRPKFKTYVKGTFLLSEDGL